MKSTIVKPPSVFPQTEEEPSPIALKAYFCAAALSGAIASQEEACPTREDENTVRRAYDMGIMMFELFIQENPQAAVRKFNKRVGL
jgi:hypothetical protein